LRRDPRQLVLWIIYINVAMFVLALLMDLKYISIAPHPLSFLSPSIDALVLLGAAGTGTIQGAHGWWSLLAANYLHAGILHIFFNMAALRQLAPLVIREYGSERMVIIYTIGGVLGFLLSFLMGVRLTIGASAAVCALVGAILYYGKSRGGIYGTALFKQVGGWVIFLFIFGFLVPGINNWGHGGGMAAGLILGYVLGYQERKPVRLWHKWIAGLCALSTVLVLMYAVATAFLIRM
jgi:rhomboid protease GluP